MNTYTVQLTFTVEADTEKEAWKNACDLLNDGDYDSDNITIELDK